MFTVALIGRPNVGKSTLFNRLVGRRLAIVDDTPGVTRDRREGEGRLGELRFRVIDTAGLEEVEEDRDTLGARMQAQTQAAMDEADVILFLIDGRAGVTPVDEHFARLLRRAKVPVHLVANKCEGSAGEAGVLEAYGLGLGDPIPLSAAHGENTVELYELLREHIERREEEEAAAAAEAEWAQKRAQSEAEEAEGPKEGEEAEEEGKEGEEGKALQLAFVGRPNVGKSTLLNKLVGEERVLTGPEAGITRDSISVEWQYRDRPIRLIDTAGLRRKARVMEKIEKLSVEDTLRAIRFAHVAVVMIDAERGIEKQDLSIARLVVEEGRALVVAVNKWDTVDDPDEFMADLRHKLHHTMPQVKGVPVVVMSALMGRNLDKLMDAVLSAYDVWNRRIGTGPLNRWLRRAVESYPPPMAHGRRIRLRYITQIKNRPPTFVVFCSQPKELPDSYERYIVNGLRETFDLPGVPVRIMLRAGDNPYA